MVVVTSFVHPDQLFCQGFVPWTPVQLEILAIARGQRRCVSNADCRNLCVESIDR
jgi:hypothetical protein